MNILKMINDEVTQAAKRYASKYGCTPAEINIGIRFVIVGETIVPEYYILKNGEVMGEAINSEQLLGVRIIDFMGKAAITDNYLTNRYAAMANALNTTGINIIITCEPITFTIYVAADGINSTYTKSLDFGTNALWALERFAKQYNVNVGQVSIFVFPYNESLFYKVNIDGQPILTDDGKHRIYTINEIMDIKFDFIENEGASINEMLMKHINRIKSGGSTTPVLLIADSTKGITTYVYDGTTYKGTIKI